MAEGIVFGIQSSSLDVGPGIRTAVFFKGCPLRCPWCANPEGQSAEIQRTRDGKVYGEKMTDDAAWREVKRDFLFFGESGGGLTLTGGEPLMQAEFAKELLSRAKSEDVHTVVETSGAVAWDAVEQVCALVDLWYFDIKHYAVRTHRQCTGRGNEDILENLKNLIGRGAKVIPRIPVIPGFNNTIEDARQFSDLLNRLGVRRVDLQPFHQAGEKKYRALGLPYAYAWENPMRVASLAPFRDEFRKRGIDARL